MAAESTERRRELGRCRTITEENIMTIAALCGFLGNIEGNDPDAAAEALRGAGYQVFRLPPELKAATCEIEGDDFIEVRREGADDDDAIDAMWADAQRIITPFQGEVDCVGAASEELFLELTGPLRPYCFHCHRPGTPDGPLLSINVGQYHVLFHSDCLGVWFAGPGFDTLVQELPLLDKLREEEF
jgi:hypothetical protein